MSSSTPQSPASPAIPATPQQWQHLISQFALFKTQLNEQQEINVKLTDKVQKLESQSSYQHNILLASYETKLEEYFYQIEQSIDDVFCQHQLNLLNLISIHIHNLDYRGAALRDLFQLRRGLVIPQTIANITVGDLVKWVQKRLKGTVANTSQYTYYHTILKSTHFEHPVMTNINLLSLPLNPHYFPSNLMLWSPQPQTPVEYHRFLIAIAYDLDYCETSILPLITHFGLPVAFPKIQMTAPVVQAAGDNDTNNKPKVKLHVDVTKEQQKLTKDKQSAAAAVADPFPYLGYSTHIPGLLYAPLWFGVLSRDSFRDAIYDKTAVDANSFITTRWFSSVCRAGYIFDQLTRIILKSSTPGESPFAGNNNNNNNSSLYPSHQAYALLLPRFFSSEDSLTDPMSYPAFGNKHFSKIYAFFVFIASHLAMAHSALEGKSGTAVSPTSVSSSSITPATPTNQSLSTPKAVQQPPTPFPKHSLATPTGKQPQTPAPNQQQHQPQPQLTLDDITYPAVRDLFNAATNGSFDVFSLSIILKSNDLYLHLTPSERNKTNFTRLFGIFHFKILAGIVPSWLAKPLLGVPKLFKPGSVFEPLFTLPYCDHLNRYFDKSCTNCCDKRSNVK